MQTPLAKVAVLVLSLGVVSAMVVQACRSSPAPTRDPANAIAPSGSAAQSASVAPAPSPTEQPTFLPASKAGIIVPAASAK